MTSPGQHWPLLLLLLMSTVTGWQDSEEWSFEQYGEPTLLASGDVTRAAAAAAGGPAFAGGQHTQLVAAAGHDVTLECAVLNIGEKAVSWVRSRDLQILSHGGAVFTADARVAAARRDVTRDADDTHHDVTFQLTIQKLRFSDAGMYECQLNTEPKMSVFYNLTVLEALPRVRVWVRGGGAVRAGSAVSLRCAARYDDVTSHTAPHPPPALHWYRDGEPIVIQEFADGGVSVVSTRGRSVLRVVPARAGRYTCRAASPASSTSPAAASADVTLLQTTDELWAESMQRDEASTATSHVLLAHTLHIILCLGFLLNV